MNDLIIQPTADNTPVLPEPAQESVPDTATNDDGNSNSEMIKLIQQLQQQMTMLGNNPPPNPYDTP